MESKVEIPIIGIIETPHTNLENMPIQPIGAKDIAGCIVIDPKYQEGLVDLEGFSDITLLYHFHKLENYQLTVTPYMDDTEHGIFATRSPKRPSMIGMSTVSLQKIEGNKVYFLGADMLSGTPLLDIKPFFRQTDNRPNARSGWLDNKDENLAQEIKSDGRFVD